MLFLKEIFISLVDFDFIVTFTFTEKKRVNTFTCVEKLRYGHSSIRPFSQSTVVPIYTHEREIA